MVDRLPEHGFIIAAIIIIGALALLVTDLIPLFG